jgi:uncharacterized FAD-dependent dehydrogenase
MIRIRDIALPFDHAEAALGKAVAEKLGIEPGLLMTFTVVRQAIDARKKNRILAVYTVDVEMAAEPAVLARCAGNPQIEPAPDMAYQAPVPVPQDAGGQSPVIVGSGPCGLLAGLVLAQAGCRPLVIERGKDVLARVKDVQTFWNDGLLDPESNVPFGEGGAGTFSDGKLTTQIKDKSNRVRKVLTEFVAAGAPAEILTLARPHIGTDNLIRVVQNLRQAILSLGGQVRFQTRLTGLHLRNGRIAGAVVNEGEIIPTDALVLAVGHSARDTFEMLHASGVTMEAKPFSIGVRIEHPQSVIDAAQYGRHAGHPRLKAADYKLVHHCPNGRAAYTFCMCPGGQVIASSSEPGGIVTNGMSVYRRNRPNANSALLVGVGPGDFAAEGPLAGIAFQRFWERKAFEIGGANYFAPVQRVGDFLLSRPSRSLGQVTPSYTPGVTCCDLAEALPDFVTETLRLAIGQLDHKLRGFAMPDAVMTAVESRSSSPVRIVRDETFQNPAVGGLYPAGEGAGYAGGIVSAAVDGIKVAEALCAAFPR